MPAAFDTLLDAIRAVAKADATHWRTLPPQAYFSPELFALERERIFRPGWICLCREDQVAAPGDYLALDVVDEPLLVVRDLEGALRVLSNVCRHRWMSLCHGSGNCKALVCPYHSWTYHLDGRLRQAPEMERTPGFDLKKIALPTFRHEIWQGFVYANLDGKAAPLAPQLAAVDAQIGEFGLPAWRVATSIDCGEYPWDWKVMQDNGECYHHIGAHLETFEATFPARRATTQVEGIQIVQHSPAREEKLQRGEDGLDYVPGYFTPLPGLTLQQRTSFTLIYVLPNFFIYLQADVGMNMRMFPVAAGRFALQCDILVPPHAFDLPDFDARLQRMADFFNRFNAEDIAINTRIQLGLQSAHARAAPLSHLEAHNLHVARWVAQQLTR